jgi:hypothetical protein
MAVEKNRLIEALEGKFGVKDGGDVVENFGTVGAAVGESEIFEVTDERKAGEPVLFFFGKMGLRPVRDLLGEDVEEFSVELPAGGVVVVAGQAYDAFFADGLDALAGLSAISDDVAGAKISVNVFLFENFQYRVERVMVAVNIAENSVAQVKHSRVWPREQKKIKGYAVARLGSKHFLDSPTAPHPSLKYCGHVLGLTAQRPRTIIVDLSNKVEPGAYPWPNS